VGVVAMTTVIVEPLTRNRSSWRRDGSRRRVRGMRSILGREVLPGCHPQPIIENAGVPLLCEQVHIAARAFSAFLYSVTSDNFVTGLPNLISHLHDWSFSVCGTTSGSRASRRDRSRVKRKASVMWWHPSPQGDETRPRCIDLTPRPIRVK